MSSRPALAFSDQGDGPALVFVHGFMNDATVWAGVTEALSDRFRCICVDLPGHGASVPTGAGTYARHLVLDDVRRLLDTLGEEQVVLVGHSLGGYLSLALTIETPGRVAGLGLVGAGPGFRNRTSLEQWNDSVRALASGSGLPEGLEEISMHVDSMVMDRLGEVGVPVTVVVGEHDTRFLASADVFDKYLEVTERTVVPDAGHMVHRKAPMPVAAALRRFAEALPLSAKRLPLRP